MNGAVIFVDLENVQTMDLSHVPADARVFVFYGVLQKKLPEDLVVQAQPLGARLRWIKIAGQGPNALDFHIAFYLGRELAERPKSSCVILSRDTGFDPLIRHLRDLGATCHRVALLKDAFPKGTARAPVDDFSRLLTLLRKEKSLPRKRKALEGKVRSWFARLDAASQQALVQRLFETAHVHERDKTLEFNL